MLCGGLGGVKSAPNIRAQHPRPASTPSIRAPALWRSGVAINPGRPLECEFPRGTILLAPALMPSISPLARKYCHAISEPSALNEAAASNPSANRSGIRHRFQCEYTSVKTDPVPAFCAVDSCTPARNAFQMRTPRPRFPSEAVYAS